MKTQDTLAHPLYEKKNPAIKLLFDDIGKEIAKDVSDWIIEANTAEKQPTMLTLIINSQGGNLCDAFAIIDIMNASKIMIKTVGLGQIQSSGLMIFLAGAPGHRTITSNTSIMSHQYSWESVGKHHELMAAAKEYELSIGRMMNLYRKTTLLDDAKIKKYLLSTSDVYLSSEDALKYGICDVVANI